MLPFAKIDHFGYETIKSVVDDCYMYFKVWSAHIYWYYLVLEVYSWEIFTALHHIYDLVMNINIFMNFLMMINKKYFAFSYGDEQEKAILISFNFWWQQNCIQDNGWLVWSYQELSWHYYRQEIFCFFLWWQTRKPIEYMFGKRDFAWPI